MVNSMHKWESNEALCIKNDTVMNSKLKNKKF